MDPYSILFFAREVMENYAKRNKSPDDLSGLCGLSAAFCRKLFKKYDYKSQLISGNYNGDTHYWTLLNYNNNEYVTDITATQFGLPKIVFDTCPNNYCADNIVKESVDRHFQYWGLTYKATNKRLNRLYNEFEKMIL